MHKKFHSTPVFADLFELDAVVESHEGSRRIAIAPLANAPQWDCRFKGGLLGDHGLRWRGELTALLREGVEPAATIGARFSFRHWSRDVYVLLPGAVYGGNRFPAFATDYPPSAPPRAASDADRRPLQTEVPRLLAGDGASCLRQMSSDPAFPGIGLFFPDKKMALWILTSVVNSLGLFGYELRENDARDAAELTIFTPGMRREFSYQICCDRVPSADRARDFAAGETARIPLRIEAFPCESVATIFESMLRQRRAMVPQPAVRHDIPFSECWRILEDKYLRENWVEPQGYFSVGVEPLRSQSIGQNWQMGWVGGMITPHALLVRGGERAMECALRNFDFVFPRGQAPSGYFYGGGDGERFVGDGERAFPEERRHLVRKSADGLFYMLSSLNALERRGMAGRVKTEWLEGLRKCADAFVRTWDTEGQLGQFVDHDTGRIVVANSCSGGIAPAALVLAARRFPGRREDYLRVARAAADHFENDYLRPGCTTGGPGDAAQCADSESLAGLAESLVTLHEETGEPRWLDAARLAALHAASWTVSYDYPFPPRSTFGKLGMLANGTVIANAQNKHSAPGICTHSGLSLLRLFRRCGETWIMDLLRDIAHTLPQYMSRADRPIPWTIPYFPPGDPAQTTLKPGYMCERVNLTFWGGHEQIGEVFYYSCWSEVSLLLTIAELPGIYARQGTGEVWSLDHVAARWKGGRLFARNTTPWPARFTALVETPTEAAATPWEEAAARIVAHELAPGEECAIA